MTEGTSKASITSPVAVKSVSIELSEDSQRSEVKMGSIKVKGISHKRSESYSERLGNLKPKLSASIEMKHPPVQTASLVEEKTPDNPQSNSLFSLVCCCFKQKLNN